MAHDAGKVGDDLSALGIERAHAAQPKAVLLASVEEGEPGVGDELISLRRRQAEGVALLFQREEEAGAVPVVPRSGVDGSAAEADEDGQVLDADRALVLAGSAGGALEGGFEGERVVRACRLTEVGEERLGAERAKRVEVGADAEGDLLGG